MRGKIVVTLFVVVVIVTFFFIGFNRYIFFLDNSHSLKLVKREKLEQFVEEAYKENIPWIVAVSYSDDSTVLDQDLDIYVPTQTMKPIKRMIGCHKPKRLLGDMVMSVNITGDLNLMKNESGGNFQRFLDGIFLQCIAYGHFNDEDFSIFRDTHLLNYINEGIFSIKQ